MSEPNTKKAISQPVSILMPVCNEAEVIESVVEEWVREVFGFLPQGSEMIFDDGASTDDTREILERLCQKYPFITVLWNERKDGFAAAARRLYGRAKCPLVFFTDADGQYAATEFWKLTPFAGDYDMVHGAKIGRQDVFFRKVASALFNRCARFIFDTHYSDLNSSFRIIKREALLELLPKLKHMPVMLNAELFIRAEMENYSIRQVRVLHRRREFGSSRGISPLRFLVECWNAYRGLLKLKKDCRL